jgi:hypothetical protein
MIFLKKMLELTKTIADPNAQERPTKLAPDMSKVVASITPTVRGIKDKYVFDE